MNLTAALQATRALVRLAFAHYVTELARPGDEVRLLGEESANAPIQIVGAADLYEVRAVRICDGKKMYARVRLDPREILSAVHDGRIQALVEERMRELASGLFPNST